MRPIDKIFAVWPTAASMARDIEVSEITVRQWRNRRGCIPPRYWSAIRSKAKKRGAELPLEVFVAASMKRP